MEPIPSSPDSLSQESAPQPSAPQPSAPQPSTPQSSTPQSSTPQSSTPQSSTPQPSTPQSSTPQSSTPQPSSPSASSSSPSPQANDAVQRRLLSHLQSIVRERDPFLASAGHFFVRQYIAQELSQWGTVEVHEFQWQRHRHQNLILKLPGTSTDTHPIAPILVGAHYDAVVGSPGADDNGTGVAALLELAQRFAETPVPFDIWFVAFDLEEYGLVGSTFYARQLHAEQQPIRLMFSLEMLGYCDPTPGSQRYPSILKWFYPDQGDFIALVGNLATLPELRSLATHMRKSGIATEWLPAGFRGHIVPATRLSDHASFWDQGYKALMVTDTSFLRNPHYHRKSDRLETLDLDFLARVCVGLEQGIRNVSF